MRTLRLREWTTTGAVGLTAAQRDALRTRFRATVEPTVGAGDRYDVTPGNVVGGDVVDVVDEIAVLVEPKLTISRVLFLLGYAADPQGWGQDDAYVGASGILAQLGRIARDIEAAATAAHAQGAAAVTPSRAG